MNQIKQALKQTKDVKDPSKVARKTQERHRVQRRNIEDPLITEKAIQMQTVF
jgi:hypothetical protein